MTNPNDSAPAPWYSRGYNAVREEKLRVQSGHRPRPFWLRPQSQHHLALLEDQPFTFDAHEFRQGEERELVTCLAAVGEDVPCCEILGAKSLSKYAAYTAIDLDGYQPKDSNKPKVKNFYTVVLAKVGLATLLEQELTDEGTLIGRRLRFSRSGEKSARAGDAVKCVDWQVGTSKLKTLDERLWGLLYNSAEWRGKKIAALLREAAENPEKAATLGQTFDLAGITDKETGRLMLGRLPVFNFLALYAPQTPQRVRAMLRGAKTSDFSARNSDSAEDPDSPPRVDDDIPF